MEGPLKKRAFYFRGSLLWLIDYQHIEFPLPVKWDSVFARVVVEPVLFGVVRLCYCAVDFLVGTTR